MQSQLKGIKLLEYFPHEDLRGYFTEIIRSESIDSFVIKQINQTKSHNKCLRGLHYQKSPCAQSKLVWVTSGAVLDVVVDINPNSPNYKQYYMVELSSQNHKMLFIPKGYAHGYITLSKETIFMYALDEIFSKEHETGIRYNDPDINIDWKHDLSEFTISEKDKSLPFLKEAA